MMIESSQSVNELPYRARIMMNAYSESGKRIDARNSALYSSSSLSIYADLQPLQWLQQDAILSIAPLDHEEEFVPGREDIVSVNTSPIKVEVVSDSASQEQDGGERSTTIADFYRYQAMRAALASVGGGQNGVRSQQGVCIGPLARPSLTHNSNLNEYQKPPFSYTHIIFMAIETSQNKAMTVNDIYVWCETHFPYYTQAGVGWKNSLRHNLSINKSFKKISRDGRGGPGRGAYWVVEPRERNNLIDAIRRSPCSLGHLSFLGNVHPWGSNTYSNNFLQSSSTSSSFKNHSLANPRSLITSKYKPTVSDLHNTALLRIGGQITDASHFIRSSPVIQRLHESNHTNIIELTHQPQIDLTTAIALSTVPLLQLEPINCQSDERDNTTQLPPDNDEESLCRGSVVVAPDPWDNDPDYGQTYLDITRSLMAERDIDKSDSGRTESIKLCPEHSVVTGSQSYTKDNRRHDNSGVIEDILPPEDVAPLSREIIKKHCAVKQRKKCTCNKDNGSESEESVTSISIADYSEQSDTDFNWRRSMGRRKQSKQKKSLFFKKLKSFKNHRKLSNRSRINNITRAPHSDHVYALLQEFLAPANTEDLPCAVEHKDRNDSFSLTTDDRSFSTDLSLIALSKRSKHKLQSKRRSSTQLCYSDSENSHINELNESKNISWKVGKEKTKKLMRRCSIEMDDSNSRNYDDKEEQENRFYDEIDSGGRAFSVSDEDWMKDEEMDNNWQESNEHLLAVNNRINIPSSVKKSDKVEPLSNKRKVGRPKKSDPESTISRRSSEHQIHRDKISGIRLKKRVKLLKNEIKYLKESNINKKADSIICKNEEQVAIDILVNLQRKNKQNRIDNMYNLSNFIDRNTSDSNII